MRLRARLSMLDVTTWLILAFIAAPLLIVVPM